MGHLRGNPVIQFSGVSLVIMVGLAKERIDRIGKVDHSKSVWDFG